VKIAMRILVVAGVVSLLAAGAMAQRPNLITWRTDFNTDPTWQNDASIYPDVGLTSGYWVHRNNPLGGGAPWTPGQFAAYCQADPFTGNDSALDGLNDNGMVWNGAWDPVFDAYGPDYYKTDQVYNFAMQKGAGQASFAWAPVNVQDIVNGPDTGGGHVVSREAGLFFLDVMDDGAGGQQVRFGTTQFGGVGTPFLAYTIINGNAVVDLENKDGDGHIIEYLTAGHCPWLTPSPTRSDGVLMATGLSNDIVEITLSIDPFTTYTATEVADHRVDYAGTETMTVNYMMVNYTINDLDGDDEDIITGQVGLAETPWPMGNPALWGTGYGGGVWDYAYIDLMAPKGDANGDGMVNDADLSLLLTGWGGAGVWGSGDFNGDGVKNDADLSLMLSKWALNCGDGSVHSALVQYADPNCTWPDAAVPEPATLALLGLGALALVRRRR